VRRRVRRQINGKGRKDTEYSKEDRAVYSLVLCLLNLARSYCKSQFRHYTLNCYLLWMRLWGQFTVIILWYQTPCPQTQNSITRSVRFSMIDVFRIKSDEAHFVNKLVLWWEAVSSMSHILLTRNLVCHAERQIWVSAQTCHYFCLLSVQSWAPYTSPRYTHTKPATSSEP